MIEASRFAVAFALATLVWVFVTEPGPADPWVAFGMVGILGIFAVTEQRRYRSRRRKN